MYDINKNSYCFYVKIIVILGKTIKENHSVKDRHLAIKDSTVRPVAVHVQLKYDKRYKGSSMECSRGVCALKSFSL